MTIKDLFGAVIVFLVAVGSGLLAKGCGADPDTAVGLSMLAMAFSICIYMIVRTRTS